MPLKPDQYRSDEENDNGSAEWMTTFADMSMLLLTFFILLFALSSLDTQRFGDFSEAMRESLGSAGAAQGGGPPLASDADATLDAVRLQRELIERQQRVFMALRTVLNQKSLEGKISALFDNGIITLRVPSDVMFDSGQVEIRPEALPLLDTVRDVLVKQNDQFINIKGFTDELPPGPDSRFRDNWEISSLRAVNVLRYMLGSGIEAKRMTATGLADMYPLFPNTTDENRAMNRRVEFVLEQRVGQ